MTPDCYILRIGLKQKKKKKYQQHHREDFQVLALIELAKYQLIYFLTWAILGLSFISKQQYIFITNKCAKMKF